MKTKVRIGIDFDRVFVNYPPVIPGALIEYLYKKRNHSLKYRIPGKLERRVRILSHAPFFRPPIKENIDALKKICKKNNSSFFLISSRFSFLKKRTEKWNSKHKISNYFQGMYFNYNDEQPHLFKNRIIKMENINKFIDDDLDLLLYLAKENPDVEFYWLTPQAHNISLPGNIRTIKNLAEFDRKYL